MMTDPGIVAQQQGFGQVSIPTPTAMIIKQAGVSPLPARHMQSSPTPSRRSVMMPPQQMQHPTSTVSSPVPSPILQHRHSPFPQPSLQTGLIHAQRPPSVISRQISPPTSPMGSLLTHHKLQPQSSPSPLMRGHSPPLSPRASVIRQSLPNSPRASMRQQSPPSSPRASMRRRIPPPSTRQSHSPFGGRKMNASPPPPISPGHHSPRVSPPLSGRPSPSPSPSYRSISPAGTYAGPTSPTLSRRSTRVLRDSRPFIQPRMGDNTPLSAVRPSPMGLRGRPVPPPTQNVRPFRASSIRSNRSSVLTVDSLHSSPFHSPHMVDRAPFGRRESGRFPSRPVARGRPLIARQSTRRMSPTSLQSSLKHMSHPTSPALSPRLSHHSSPHLPPRTFHSPSFEQGAFIPSSHADSHHEVHDPFIAPSSPLLSSALQNENIQRASLNSPFVPHTAQMSGMNEMASEYVEPYVPSSPLLSEALQKQAIRDASYVSPLRPQSPYTPSVPSSPMLSGAMRHGQALRAVASYQTPTLYSPYGPTVTQYDYISEPGPPPLLHDALQNRSNLQTVSSLRSPIMARHNPYAPVGPKVHSALQQNPNIRQATYHTPLQLRRNPYGPLPPSSPRLGQAIQNPQLMQASYQLPDGTLVSPYADPRTSPMLGQALQNQQVRQASYILPDGSVIRVGVK